MHFSSTPSRTNEIIGTCTTSCMMHTVTIARGVAKLRYRNDLLSHSHDMVWEGHCNGGRTDGCDISLRLSILSITMAALFPNTPDASVIYILCLIPASRWLAQPLILFTGTAICINTDA